MAWDNGFQKHFVCRFYEGHQINIVFNFDCVDLLAWVAFLIRMIEGCEDVTHAHMKYDIFERSAPLVPQEFIFLQIPCERLHSQMLGRCVPFVRRLNRVVSGAGGVFYLP